MNEHALPCPECGFTSVVANAPCMVEVGPGLSGFVYGRPEVLVALDSRPAQCNSSRCGWTGTVGDVRAVSWIEGGVLDSASFDGAPGNDRVRALRDGIASAHGLASRDVAVALLDSGRARWWRRGP